MTSTDKTVATYSAPNPDDVRGPLPLHIRLSLWAALLSVTTLAWLYLFQMPMTPDAVGGVGTRLLATVPPQWANAWLAFMMWAVMMVAMMLPSASPMILVYARMCHVRSASSGVRIALFAAGYAAAWTLFSAAATAAQYALAAAALLSSALSATPMFGAAILFAAGLYQLTPIKQVCLGRCQSPIGFFMTHWRDGAMGALRMGLVHGAFCIGCCWLLMALLFVAGVMNLAWVAAISIFVLLERAAPWGRRAAHLSGLALVAGALAVAFFR